MSPDTKSQKKLVRGHHIRIARITEPSADELGPGNPGHGPGQGSLRQLVLMREPGSEATLDTNDQ